MHRDEYDWHIESSKWSGGRSTDNKQSIAGIPVQYFEPFPRVSVHGSYLFMAVKKLRHSKTVLGRREAVNDIMKEGYCYSLPKWNVTELTTRRCKSYHLEDTSRLPLRGQYRFEQYPSPWTQQQQNLGNSNDTSNIDKVRAMHKNRMSRYEENYAWDEDELLKLFGF